MANFNIDYLVVAGGGGGGNAQGSSGSGGGAGEFLYQTSQSLTTGGSGYAVIVGAGGSGGTGSAYPSANGLSGSDSFFIRSVAGGGAGLFSSPGNSIQSVPGGSGGGARAGTGSTGGASTAVSPGIGNAGGGSTGNGAGGGGGAGSAGTTGTTSLSGSGGNGLQNSITGVNTYYAGGGGAGNFANSGGSIGSGGSGIGGTSSFTGTAGSGVNNTGSGGAGGSYNTSNTAFAGGNGGSGVVILRYATADVAGYTATSLTPTEDTTTVAGQTILSFTTVGTGSITFTAPTPPTPTFDGTKVTTPVTGFQSSVDVGLKMPVGTNSNLPTGVEGMIRNDTDEVSGGTNSTTAITFYNGTDWKYFTSAVSPDSPPIENFNTVLYDGNSSTKIIDTVGFQPDLVWTKGRTFAGLNGLTDSINGNNTFNIANATNAMTTNSSAPKNFNSLGFTLGAGNNNWNGSPYKYVAWCFKAGGAAVTNNDGSIASQVSVNNNLGFSIVKTTGTSGTINFGHGLDTAPEMIINKGLTSNGWSWLVYHKDIGTGKYLKLNSIDTETPNANSFSSVTSTTITNNSSNGSSDYINYCFTSKPGLSKVGSYIGNGNTNGPTVTLGFEPAWVMIKGANEQSGWLIIDNKRSPSNPANKRLDADDGAVEVTETIMDLNSDNFQLKTASAGKNASGKTFIYLAFAT